ncbi:FxSxx-COOH system tetratricopeptide repeat protein, partial [Hamadaea tsunoensis]|uniref:FxSxx-COOH system tetratricopeptide repeat protein n=1 Tax=Hamadaea tsunoensis TaxID=53368 RepID=UPI00047FFFE3
MAIALPGLDQLPPGPRRAFVEALHVLYDAAGRPGARVISTAIRQDRSLRETVSHETVSATLRGGSVPASFAKVVSIVIVLNRMSHRPRDEAALLDEFNVLWLATQSSTESEPRETAGEQPGIPSRPRVERMPPPIGFTVPEVRTVRIDTDTTPLIVPRQPMPTDVITGGLPERNAHFTGREVLLDTMRDRLQAHPHTPLVLYGIGGVGKTQLAREYIERYAGDYSLVWWIPSDRAERARAALVDLAERLEVPSRFYADQTVAAVINALESQRHRYILIFDGVEDDEIHDLVPSFGGHVIITTRDPSWAHDNSTIGIEISDFDRAEAFQFLRRRGSDLPATEAEELIRAVGRLPLVLEQIVAVRMARGWSWAELVQQISKPDQTILSAGQPAHYAHNVEVTLDLAMTQLGTDNAIAAVAFEMFAWFGSEPVSIALMKSGVRGEVSAALLRVLRDPVQFPKTLADISRYGLARLNSNTQRVEVQPFVRLTLRDILSPEARERARQNVHEILMAADPGWPDDLTYLGMHRELAPHVLPSELISSRKEAAQQTVVNQIRYRYLVGDHENAARLAEEAVTTWKQQGLLGPDHAYVLQATREWANALRAIGRYREARDLTADAMERLHGRAEFGEHHPHTLAQAMGYAADLRIVGRYREALEVDNDNHRRHVLVYGEEHGRTATSRHNV